jgi:hypothetical protein
MIFDLFIDEKFDLCIDKNSDLCVAVIFDPSLPRYSTPPSS